MTSKTAKTYELGFHLYVDRKHAGGPWKTDKRAREVAAEAITNGAEHVAIYHVTDESKPGKCVFRASAPDEAEATEATEPETAEQS